MRAHHILLLVIFSTLTGCAAVKPWERGTLSKPAMQVTPRMGDEYLSHVSAVREGSLSSGGIGGGCGCN